MDKEEFKAYGPGNTLLIQNITVVKLPAMLKLLLLSNQINKAILKVNFRQF